MKQSEVDKVERVEGEYRAQMREMQERVAWLERRVRELDEAMVAKELKR